MQEQKSDCAPDKANQTPSRPISPFQTLLEQHTEYEIQPLRFGSFDTCIFTVGIVAVIAFVRSPIYYRRTLLSKAEDMTCI